MFISFCCNFCSVYGEPIPVKELADRVASYVHLCTLYWWLRFDKIPKFFIHCELFFIIFLKGLSNVSLQTFWMWSYSWWVWQRWATTLHGWTLRHFICELIVLVKPENKCRRSIIFAFCIIIIHKSIVILMLYCIPLVHYDFWNLV